VKVEKVEKVVKVEKMPGAFNSIPIAIGMEFDASGVCFYRILLIL
jgi:hypothetical protein